MKSMEKVTMKTVETARKTLEMMIMEAGKTVTMKTLERLRQWDYLLFISHFWRSWNYSTFIRPFIVRSSTTYDSRNHS